MKTEKQYSNIFYKEVLVRSGSIDLPGEISIPENATGVVLFSHGSGSSRLSPRNQFVAKTLVENGIGTFLFDLLTETEDTSFRNRFNIELITERLIDATNWFQNNISNAYNIGYFGASTGAAAALWAASSLPSTIKAVVSRGGRPDLAIPVLPLVIAPTLLLVGSLDDGVIDLNETAFNFLNCEKEMIKIEGASHLFEEPGKLERVSDFATSWFKKFLENG